MNISTIHRKQVTNPEENYIIEFIDVRDTTWCNLLDDF